jgi:DNA repair exonuclease SbcCD ATPase subunit
MRIFSAHESMENTSVHNQNASRSNATLRMRLFQQHATSQDDISRLEQEKRESENQLSQLKGAAKQLQTDKGTLQSELNRIRGEDGTITRLENKIRDLRVEIRNLESTSAEKETRISELQLQLKSPASSLDDLSLKKRNRGMRSPETTGSRLLVLQTLQGDIGSNFAVGPDILDSLYQTSLLYKDGFEDNYQKYKRQPPRSKASWQCLREILCDGHRLAEEISGIRRCRTCTETRSTCLQVRNVQGETVLRAFPQASDMGGDVFT